VRFTKCACMKNCALHQMCLHEELCASPNVPTLIVRFIKCAYMKNCVLHQMCLHVELCASPNVPTRRIVESCQKFCMKIFLVFVVTHRRSEPLNLYFKNIGNCPLVGRNQPDLLINHFPYFLHLDVKISSSQKAPKTAGLRGP
jgi:hypothetical protein